MIPVSEVNLGREEEDAVIDSIRKGWITSGEKVKLFESRFARYCGTKFGVATSNGTAALHLTLAALGISRGDEVIMPALTFISSANAVAYCGARPVLAESEGDTYNMDASRLEKLATRTTKAIMPVHLYGHPCDMDAINEIAEKHGIPVIEDAAEAHGAEYKGRKAGSLGRAGCFSFYGNKIMTTGEGGMVTTDDGELYEKMQLLKNQGKTPGDPFFSKVVGFNYRMTDIQAALGLAQLEKVEKFIAAKRRMASLYNKELNGLEGISLPNEKAYARHVYWMYAPLIKSGRDALITHLKSRGIETRKFFNCIHKQPCYAEYKGMSLLVAERLAATGINLPSSTKITDDDIMKVCGAVRDFFRRM